MKQYDHKKIEKKWQKGWAKKKIYATKDDSPKPKFYVLDMFPYPSGEGLHVGHPKGYIATDIVSRMKRMQGHNVLHPMGFDAFGLPAENYAILTKTNPVVAVAKNVARYKKQLEIIGFDYDWSREINTTDPKYYKWTQWIFLKLLEKGLAYESYEPINWCPSCKTGLANEDVEDGRCERCGTPVEKKPMRQWVLKITDYADRLLKDLDTNVLPNGDIFETLPNGEFGITHMNSDVPGKVRLDKPFVPRNAICAFVEHWSEKKFIVLKWKKVDWTTPITGGIEKGQTPEEAARAEIFEETGFKNLTLVKRSAGQYHSTFFHPPKDENRVGHFTSFYFKLKDGEQAPVVADEQAKHEVTWLPEEKVRDAMTAEGSKLGWDLVMDGAPRHIVKPLLDWPESIKEAQRNWIGRSEGAEIDFAIKNQTEKIKVFTTRPDTLFGVTYVVLSPEHPLVEKLLHEVKNEKEVVKYVAAARIKTEIERTDAKKEKTGVELKGIKAVNPVNGEEVPVWIADYVLADYGTGAVMGVPKHDERDAAFAEKFKLPVKDEPFADRNAIEKAGGKWVTKYKLKDWVFSRQRYWGEPIPVLHNGNKIVPVSEKDLPVVLPKVKYYEPTGTGESPLAEISKWVNFKGMKRETNTMPQWAGSSWYYLRYMDPKDSKVLVSPKKEKYWNSVDFYVGGAEHATRHLIYARFWHKFLYDIGVVSTIEPFKKLQSVGLIMGEDGRKMSKRFGNVVNPDDIVATYGADTLRVYEMFMGPFDQAIAWSTDSMIGSRRFIERVWKVSEKTASGSLVRSADSAKTTRSPEAVFSSTNTLLHKTIKKVTEDIANLRFNTAISSLMILQNAFDKVPTIARADFESYLKLLAPFAPHISEELWRSLGNKKSIHLSDWPKWDEAFIKDAKVNIAVQVNGKVRAVIEVPADADEDAAKAVAFAASELEKWLSGKTPSKIIYVKNKIINFIVPN